MFYFDRRLLANVDWLLLAAAACVLALGGLTLGSLTMTRAGSGLVLRQLLWDGVGVGSGRRPPSTWRGCWRSSRCS